MASVHSVRGSADWDGPAPRAGMLGAWDRFVGPGATAVENALFIGATAVGAAWVVAYGLLGPVNWSGWQIAVLALVGGDLLGGAVANASRPTRRWYHRPGQGVRQHLAFTASHVTYVALIGWLFLDLDIPYIVGVSAALLVSAMAVLRAPLPLRRPVAAGLVATAALAGALTGPPSLAWFLPVLWLKLILGHAVR
jgi:hypothetical protein